MAVLPAETVANESRPLTARSPALLRNYLAVAKPIPLEPPVMSTVFSFELIHSVVPALALISSPNQTCTLLSA